MSNELGVFLGTALRLFPYFLSEKRDEFCLRQAGKKF